jgi:hypothetical protein
MGTKVAAASPVAENNALINAGMVATTGLTLASAVPYARSFLGAKSG